MRRIIFPAIIILFFTNINCGHFNPAGPSGLSSGFQEVWVSPNVGSNMLDLFTHPDEWAGVRTQITVMGFLDGHLRYGYCKLCGPENILPNFLNIVPGGAFRWLNEHNIKIAIETGSVKEWDCSADVGISYALEAIGNVQTSGGQVAYLSMDEPFASGLPNQQDFSAGIQHCNYSVDQVAENVANYIRQVNSAYPQVKVGLIEPYPYFTANQIESFADAIMSKGVPLPFFHLDFDPNYSGINFTDDLKNMRNFFKQRGIPFGAIIIGGNGTSNESAVSGALTMAARIGSVIGIRNQEHLLIQSWLDNPFTRGQQDLRLYPDNLPESNPMTMMGLVRTVLNMR